MTETTDDDPLPECSLFKWLSGLATDPTCDNEFLSADTLRMCLRDERDQARRFLARHGDALKGAVMNERAPDTTEPISQDPKTQNQVAGILLIRATRIEVRQRANGCNRDNDPMDWGRPCCDLCECAAEADGRGEQIGFGTKETTEENTPCPKNIT